MRKNRIIFMAFVIVQWLASPSLAGVAEDFLAAEAAFQRKDCGAAEPLYQQVIKSAVLSIENLASSYLHLSQCKVQNDAGKFHEYLWRFAQIKGDIESYLAVAKHKLKTSEFKAFSKMGKWTTLEELKSQQEKALKPFLAENGHFAITALANKEYDKAIFHYTQALKIGKLSDFEEAQAYFDRSIAHEKQGRLKEAIDDMENFAWILPNDTHGNQRIKDLQAKSK